MKYLFTCLVLFLLFSCKQAHTKLGPQTARQELKQALTQKSGKLVFVENLISNKQTAIDVAEPILFKIYGKDDIIREKPYEIYSMNGYWILSGTLPEGMLGGTFLIILSAKDGRVIKLTHGK